MRQVSAVARCVVEDGWTLRRAAERLQVSPTTAQRWAGRYRASGEAGMSDLSSRPSIHGSCIDFGVAREPAGAFGVASSVPSAHRAGE